jgi:hypothetical protein
MTPQVTDRIEGGLASCHGHSRKLRIFTWCTYNWRGKCPGMGWWWRELKEANNPPAPAKIHKNSAKNTLLGLKIAESIIFRSKILNKIYSTDVF